MWLTRCAQSIAVLCCLAANMVNAADDAAVRETAEFPLVKKLHVDTGRPRSVAFSPDGRQLVIGNDSFAYQLFDVFSGRVLREDESAGSSRAIFSHDGKAILAGMRSGKASIRVFDVATGKSLRDLKGHTDDVMALAVSPDGKHVASASMDGTCRLWDAATGETLHALKGHETWVTSVAFSPDGKMLASTSNDGTLRLWDAGVGRQLRSLKPPQPPDRALPPEMRGVAWSPDGRWLTTAGWDKNVHVWDAQTGKLLHNMAGHTQWNLAVTASPDGRLIASSSMDTTVRLWDPRTGNAVVVLTGHGSDIWGLAFSPDGSLLASASDDQTIRLWLVGTPSKVTAELVKQEQSTAVKMRTWKMRWGGAVEAKFLEISRQRVYVERSDGRVVSFDLYHLSKTDQEYAQSRQSARPTKTTAGPAKPAQPDDGRFRLWTSRNGPRFRAELLESSGPSLRMKKSDGQEFSYPSAWLSDADQAYVRSLRRTPSTPPKASEGAP
ncbi:MAG: PD40 domain-containing protein [Pirellulaceae bacterium]|nr:PD40 domain-containing protein [Pirellulaceae bacterium]